VDFFHTFIEKYLPETSTSKKTKINKLPQKNFADKLPNEKEIQTQIEKINVYFLFLF
jgi:hypothetical protein